MKYLFTIFGAFILVFFILTGCTGGIKLADPPTDLKYDAVPLIDGPLSEYIEAIPGQYLFELEKNEDEYSQRYQGLIKVKFKILKSIDIKAGRGYNYYGPGLEGRVLDEQDAPLEFNLSTSSDKDLATYLLRGSGEEWLVLKLSGQGLINSQSDADKMLDKFKKGKKIRFNSEIIEEKFSSETKSSTDSDKESQIKEGNSELSVDCEEYLKGYEKFMDNYIAIIKKYKANPSDASILTDYTSMLTKAQEWAEKTSDCAADINFAAKFSAIQIKIANAAAELK